MLKSFGILCGGDYGGVSAAREILVAVREVDRPVLLAGIDADLGLVTCNWSRIGLMARHSTPWSRGAGETSGSSQRVDEGESRDREQVANGATGGKRTKG